MLGEEVLAKVTVAEVVTILELPGLVARVVVVVVVAVVDVVAAPALLLLLLSGLKRD